MTITEKQLYRYARQLVMPEIDEVGQQFLLSSKVVILGAGGLGSAVIANLAAAGIGELIICDNDIVDLSNLQRQILHFTQDVGRPKVLSGKEKLEAMNPDVKVETYQEMFMANNALDLLASYDFIIDGTDNFAAKFLINDACVLAKKPFSHAGILRFDGQTMTHVPGTATYRCVFKEPPPAGAVPTCSQAGVLGAVAGIMGTIQACEALRYLLGVGELLTNQLLVMDARSMQFRSVKVKPQPITVTELTDAPAAVCDLKGGS